MIERYTDHAANERTCLACVRSRTDLVLVGIVALLGLAMLVYATGQVVLRDG